MAVSMKTFFIVLFVLLNCVLKAQSSNLAEKLADLNIQLVNKISVGSSPEEVKKILGKPTAVEAGFPDSDEMIFFDEFPFDQVGQLNYTTWFYKLSTKKLTYTVYADTTFFLNGEEVTSDLYRFYIEKDSIYYWPICSINSKSASLELYNYYLDKDSVYINQYNLVDLPPYYYETASVNSRGTFVNKVSQEINMGNLITNMNSIKNYSQTLMPVKKVSQEMKIEKQHTASASFLPVLCIVFEKGTNVVALSKVFFQWL